MSEDLQVKVEETIIMLCNEIQVKSEKDSEAFGGYLPSLIEATAKLISVYR